MPEVSTPYCGEFQMSNRFSTVPEHTGHWLFTTYSFPKTKYRYSFAGFAYTPPPYPGITIPAWMPTMLIAAVATAPWIDRLRWRFSLRTLLIATTIIAVVLGIAAYATK